MVAASLAALLLAVRLGSDVPEVGEGPVALRLLEAPQPTPFGCRLRVQLYAARTGDALLFAPPITCAWGRGQASIAHVELGTLPSIRNPGGFDSAKRWARRGVHRTGRVVEHRIAAIGDPSPGPLERARRRVGSDLDPEGEGSGGAVLRALITGDRSRITDRIRSPFSRSGTAHLLAVSGLHVGWAFAAGRLILLGLLYPWPGARLQRSRRRLALGAGVGVAVLYAGLAGLSVSSVRAALMAAAGAVAVLGGRPGAGWNALSGAALVILVIEPASLFEPSFGLSFLAVAGILLFRPEGGAGRRLLECSVGAGLATAPLVVALGLPLPMLGVVANLLLVPWFTWGVVPLGLVCALLSLAAPSLVSPLASIARKIAEIGMRGAELLESPDLLPFASSPLEVTLPVLILFAARLGLRGARRPAMVLCVLAAALYLGGGFVDRERPHEPELLFLDVGQGDATLVRGPTRTWLVDAGPPGAGRRVVLPALRSERVSRLDLLVLTHADQDHLGGAASVLERVPVGELWAAAATYRDPAFGPVRRVARGRGVPIRLVSRGHERSLDGVRLRVLWPPPELRAENRNDGGLVLRLDHRSGCAMLPGDVSRRVEERLVGEAQPCGLLKLAHHGSGTSSGDAWLGTLGPDLAIASASGSRTRLFPAAAVRARLQAHQVTLYETARSGAIRVRLAPPLIVIPTIFRRPD